MDIRIKLFALLLICLSAPVSSIAHDGLHEAIKKVTDEIRKDPNNPKLYYSRALLYKEHKDYDLALADFNKTLLLQPGTDLCYFQISDLYLNLNLYESSLLYINYFMETSPNNPFAYEVRAKVYQATGQDSLAISDLWDMVKYKNEDAIRPEDYFSLADGILASDPKNYEAAISALQAGMNRLGNNIALTTKLIDLYLESNNYPKALALVDATLKTMPRKEAWLIKKAEILEISGQNAAAESAYREAIRTINELRPRLRQTDFVQDLKIRAEKNLEKLLKK